MAMYAENTVDGTWAGWLKFTATLKSADKSYKYSVRPEILDSWVRCRQAKVNPNDEAIHHRLETASLQVMLRKNKDLITIAKPFMDNLYQIVAGSGFVVALTDVRGYVMEIFGDKDTN
ncbi:MAG: acoR 1 [Firmicutes bacterium]|nr:acoR 1 [Bacillota bacterium]